MSAASIKSIPSSKNCRSLMRKTLCRALSDTPHRLTPPEGFRPPLPRPMIVADGNYLGFITASLAIISRLGSGVFVLGWTPFASQTGPWPGTFGSFRDGSNVLPHVGRPTQPIVLYDSEASANCRVVREACSILDLIVEYRPCHQLPEGWITDERSIDPVLIDGETRLSSSEAILDYLFEKYGTGRKSIPWAMKGIYASMSGSFSSFIRSNAGSYLFANARSDLKSLQPLTLWGFEGSPFVRPVRETLCSLGLTHVYVNCARGSNNRDKLFEMTGRFQVPFLQDPNTGVEMFESGDIVKYLMDMYTVKP